jgi:hypothetical protein
LAKRGHGSQRVHIVPPLHDLAVPDGNDRDEPVVVGCAGSDNFTVHLVFEDYYTSILGSMYDERVRAVQQDVVAVTRIKCHQCFATIKLVRPTREKIAKLEDRLVGNCIEIMVAIDQASQTLLDYVEERSSAVNALYFGSVMVGFLAVVWGDSGGAAPDMIASMPLVSRRLCGPFGRAALATAADRRSGSAGYA